MKIDKTEINAGYGLKWEIETKLENSVIFQSTIKKMESFCSEIATKVISTEDEHIKKALISLGWTPPKSNFMTCSNQTHHNQDVHVDDSILVRNVLANMRGKRGEVFWGRVTDVFAIGSGSAYALCNRFGFNPEKIWRGNKWQ